MTVPTASNEHPEPETLARYLEGRLDGDRRAKLAAHLAECPDCRQEMIDARRVLSGVRTRRRVAAVAGIAAAAALVVFVVPANWFGSATNEADLLRTDHPAAALIVHGPLGQLPVPPTRFVWGTAGANAVYRISVTWADGTPVWRESTTDTIIALPEDVTLMAGAAYRWWVDAVLPDGDSRSTGVREFRIQQ